MDLTLNLPRLLPAGHARIYIDEPSAAESGSNNVGGGYGDAQTSDGEGDGRGDGLLGGFATYLKSNGSGRGRGVGYGITPDLATGFGGGRTRSGTAWED